MLTTHTMPMWGNVAPPRPWRTSAGRNGNQGHPERRSLLPDKTPEPPWKRATSKRKSLRSERQAAKLDNGKVQPMSGAGRKKGDVLTSMWLIEDKITEARSFTVTVAMLDKIEAEAVNTPPSKLPQLRLTLPGHRWRMLREEDYLYLQSLAAQK